MDLIKAGIAKLDQNLTPGRLYCLSLVQKLNGNAMHLAKKVNNRIVLSKSNQKYKIA